MSGSAWRPAGHGGGAALLCLAVRGESPVCSRAAVVGPLGLDKTPLYRAVLQVLAESRGATRAGERAGLFATGCQGVGGGSNPTKSLSIRVVVDLSGKAESMRAGEGAGGAGDGGW